MQAREIPGGYFVVLDRGEEIIGSLTAFAKARGLEGGSLSAIGALEKVTVGYFDLATRTYDKKLLAGEYELVSLNGNLSLVDGEPFVHAHCTLGLPDYSLAGGHLFSGIVAVTAEVELRLFDAPLKRAKNAALGLNLLSL